MKFLKYITIILFFTACVTQKQEEMILKKCQTSSFKKDTVWHTFTEKADTVLFFTEGPTQYLPNPCQVLCDSVGNLKPFKQASKKNGIKQSLNSIGNVLVQECDADSVKLVNKTLTIENNRLINEKTEVHENCKLPHITPLDYFFIISSRIFWIIILVYVGWWAIKKFIFKR